MPRVTGFSSRRRRRTYSSASTSGSSDPAGSSLTAIGVCLLAMVALEIALVAGARTVGAVVIGVGLFVILQA